MEGKLDSIHQTEVFDFKTEMVLNSTNQAASMERVTS